MTRLSVVVPTYNRGPRLADAITGLFRCSIDGLAPVEIVVVDDGSVPPAESVLRGVRPPTEFSVSALRQENRGPASARNAGFRSSSGDIVLFMDDDIQASPELLVRHVEAHTRHARAVVFGPSLWPSLGTRLGVAQVLRGIGAEAGDSRPQYGTAPFVASGHLSVERASFEGSAGVYRDDLATPGAEELELTFRLRAMGLQLVFAAWIEAVHDCAVSLEALCEQQYKHGLGYAEVALKRPEVLELEAVSQVIRANTSLLDGSPLLRLNRLLKRLAVAGVPRGFATRLGSRLETTFPRWEGLSLLYHHLIALHFIAGVIEGTRRFAPTRTEIPPDAEGGLSVQPRA
jgi:glycosyltransferase involved in cell wall biosynthesis